MANWRVIAAVAMLAAAFWSRKPSADTRMAAVVDAAGMYAHALLHRDAAPTPPAPKPDPGSGEKPKGEAPPAPVATPTCTPGGCPLVPQRAPVKRYYQPAPPRLFPRLFGS